MAQRFRPTLIIGVGEQGAAVGARLMARLKRGGHAPPLWRFLFIDRPPIDRHLGEVTRIGGPRITLEWQELALPDPPARTAVAGAFAGKAGALYEQIGRIYAQVTDLPLVQRLEAEGHALDTHTTDVFLLAALDDPVGGSLFLDVAYLVRAFLQNLALHERIKGFLLLPPAFDTDVDRDARTYAALKELEFVVERSLFERRYSDALSVRVPRRPFDATFLLDATNERGQSFASRDDLHGLVAELCHIWLTSPLGDEVDAGLVSVRVPPRFAGGRMGAYGSLGLSGAWFPGRVLHRIFARRWAVALLRDQLLGEPAAGGPVEEVWRRFLHAWPWLLGEPDGLLQRLARDEQGRSVLLPPPAPPFEEVPPQQLLEVMDLFYERSLTAEPAGEDGPAPPEAESPDPVERELARLKARLAEERGDRAEASASRPPAVLGEVVGGNLERLLVEMEESVRIAVRALLDAEAPGALALARQWIARAETHCAAVGPDLATRLQEARHQVDHWQREQRSRRALLQAAVSRRPAPVLVLGRSLATWGLGLSALWAGLEQAVNRGWLLSPPLLVRIFSNQATGGEPVQTVLLGAAWGVAFVVQGMALAEARQRPLAQVRDAYLESWQNLVRWRMERQVLEAAALVLERLTERLAASVETLERFQRRLEQVAEQLAAEEQELWQREMQPTFVTAEWVLPPEAWERLYTEMAGEPQRSLQAAVEALGPVHGWGQHAAADLQERLASCGLDRLRAHWAEDAETFLARQCSVTQLLERLEGWYRAASPLLRYSAVHLRGEGEFLMRNWLGVPDPARSPLGERARGYRGDMSIAASGDPEWLRCLRVHSQMPLYALVPVSRYRRAYVQRGPAGLHRHPGFEDLPDLFPDSLVGQESPWHAWLVIGVGLDLVTWREEGFFFLFSGYHLLLGRDTRESLDYLHTHPDVADALHNGLRERVRELGARAVRERLQAFQQDAPLSQASRESVAHFLGQDLPEWVADE